MVEGFKWIINPIFIYCCKVKKLEVHSTAKAFSLLLIFKALCTLKIEKFFIVKRRSPHPSLLHKMADDLYLIDFQFQLTSEKSPYNKNMRPAFWKWAEKNAGDLAEHIIFAADIFLDSIDSEMFPDAIKLEEIATKFSTLLNKTKEIHYKILECIHKDVLELLIYVPKEEVPWEQEEVNEYLNAFIQYLNEVAADTYQEGECGEFIPKDWGYAGSKAKKAAFFLDALCAEILESNELDGEDPFNKVDIDTSTF
jgi:hypothetical protein